MEILSNITDSAQLQSYSKMLSEFISLGLDFTGILDIFHFMEFKKQQRNLESTKEMWYNYVVRKK